MAKPTTKKRKTTNDLFEALSQNAENVPQKKSSKTKERPQVELDETQQLAFEAFCSSDVICKIAEGKQKASKALILPILRQKVLKQWLEQGRKTENPVVQTTNARANFVVRNILKIDIPENEDGTPGSINKRLVEAGFNEEEAEKIAEQEFSERVELNFRSLNELRDGEVAEQRVIKKLMSLVLDNFTIEEQRLLLRKETKVEVNENFIENAIEHANGSFEKLDALLSVASPQWVLSQMTYSGGDLKQEFEELTGGDLPEMEVPLTSEEFYSADNQWKAVVQGDKASLYKCSEEEGEILLGTKKCNGGPNHARMTCKKWLRDDSYRSTTIADFLTKK